MAGKPPPILHMSYQATKGFSLVELIVVIILLGILGVAATSKLFDSSSFEASSFHLEAINAFRYAQKTAIATGCEVEASLLSGGSFAVNFKTGGTDTSCGNGAFSEPVLHPDMSGPYAATAPAGISISNDLIISFNSAGSPSSGGAWTATIGGNPITVEAVTGFVY